MKRAFLRITLLEAVRHITRSTTHHTDGAKMKPLNQQLSEQSSSSDAFSKNLCYALVCADIPFENKKISNFRFFREIY